MPQQSIMEINNVQFEDPSPVLTFVMKNWVTIFIFWAKNNFLGESDLKKRCILSLYKYQKALFENESCQEFGGQTVLQIEAVHNLRKVRMYLNVLSLRSTN